jgi:serine/threonine-protein kinase
MVGRRLGRFTILSLLGQGGMASVWRARDELSGRDVAVKVLAEAFASSPDARRRFRREAEIAALLDHPSIAPVYEAGEQDGSVYLAMALINGRTLSERLALGLPSLADGLRTGALAAEALGYAHGRGILHRDVSSRNIMVADDGRVYVLDFGLALAYDRSRLSSTGQRLGTIAFMSPEVMRGDEADPRSDVYGLGVTLYHFLTGNFPFTGERDEVVVYQRLNVPISPPSALRPEILPELDRIILMALAREPADRWQSADDLARSLRTLSAAMDADHGNGGMGEPAGKVRAGSEAAPGASGELTARLASGSATVYLALLPFASDGDSEQSTESATRIARGLPETLAAGVAQLDRVHMVAVRGSANVASPADLRTVARRSGANLALQGSVRAAGTAMRVTFSLVDPESGVQVGGGNADGSSTMAFELEDRLVAELRRALGPVAEQTPGSWRSQSRDPAGAEKHALALRYLHRFDNEASLGGAIELLEGLVASDGESVPVLTALTRAFIHKYRLTRKRVWEARASGACEKARQIDPGAPDVLLATGELHVAAGRNADALAVLDRLLQLDPDHYDASLARAAALEGLGRIAESEEVCQRAIASRPDDWRGYYTLGMILFHQGRYAQSIGPWRRIAELVPDNAGAYRSLGSTYFRMGHLQEALAAFRLSKEIRPNAAAFNNLGTVLYRLERYEESVGAFEKAVALNPSDPLSWGNLGSACRYLINREDRMRVALEKAIGLLGERLSREPAGGEEWARLASWHANLGQNEEALCAIRRAVGMSPQDVYCMVAAASTYLDLGDRPEALRWLRRAVESGYGVESLGRKTAFRALEGDPEFERILADGSRLQGANGEWTEGGKER